MVGMVLVLLWTLGGCVQWEGGDADDDGVSIADGDCDDLNDAVGPGQAEIWYDGVDQDCDGNDADQDGDGFLAAAVGGDDCWDDPTVIPEGYAIITGQGFLQPSAIDVHPDATEAWYDGVDGDCDGQSDFDQDGDSYDAASAPDRDGLYGDDCVDSEAELEALGVEVPAGLSAADIHPGVDPLSDDCYDGINLDCDARDPAADNTTTAWDSDFDCDQDGWMADQDCNDEDPTAVPDLTIEEVWYDCVDQNCDSNDGDQDGDGFIPEDYTGDCPDWLDLHGGDQATVVVGDCWDGGSIVPADYTALNGFPQLDAIDVYPGAADTWYDGIDADCAGDSDFDADGDGQDTDGYSDGGGGAGADCDDSEPTIYLGATEYCDGVDRDCDGLIGDDDDAVDAIQFYFDEDDDGYGTAASKTYCEPTGDYRADNSDDCDDTDAATHPEADEYCDDVDRDCDGQIDEDHALDASTWYTDGDGDGAGDPATADVECDAPSGTVANQDDCDDTDATVNPGAAEVCDGQLNDCDATGLPSDESDDDGDGFVECTWDAGGWDGTAAVGGGDDCDDADGLSFPGGTETCDGVADEDCDGEVDEDDASDVVTWYRDGDTDGYGWVITTLVDCDQPSGFVADGSDCDDSDATTFPGAAELCDGQQNDCDAAGLPSDESDDDGDGFVECTFDAGGWDGTTDVLDDEDCDDGDALSFPGGTETCDGTADEDCDGAVDEADAVDAEIWYRDADVDSYGDSATTKIACSLPAGYVADDTDCDDGAASVNPGASEVCDGSTDEDCDGQIDEDDAADVVTWYADTDGDGYGDASDAEVDCEQPTDFVTDATDCDDDDETVYPAATELCDGLLNDCDGSALPADETDDDGDDYVECSWDAGGWDGGGGISGGDDCDDADADSNPDGTEVCDGSADEDCDGTVDEDTAADAPTWYADADGDTYGDEDSSQTACSQPSSYVSDDTDCDDGDGSVNPGADELCDGSTDEDCDGDVDEDDATDVVTWYDDGDSDGYGDAGDSELDCDAPGGHVADGTDCDDTDATIFPSASELCDGQLNDCDGGGLPADESDDDTDGFVECTFDAGGWDGTNDVLAGDDCDDGDILSFPGGTETCDGTADEDCDGDVDEDDASDASAYYTDADGDGYGDSTTLAESCSPPSTSESNGDDCDDTSSSVSPVGTEVCGDGIDQDCDGQDAGCTVDLATADLVLLAEAGGDRAGFAVDAAGDLTGDGVPDLLVGAYKSGRAGKETGSTFVATGTQTGSVDLGTTSAVIEGWDVDGRSSYDLMGNGDGDGDGQVDVLIGAYAADGTGEAYLVLGPVTATFDLAAADATVSTVSGNVRIGISVGFLTSHDGGSDDAILVGADKYDDPTKDEGQVMVFVGASGALTATTATATILGEQASSGLGFAVDGTGDVDGDGLGDLLLSAQKYDDGSKTDAGAAYVMWGPLTGSLTVASADETTVGTAGARLGQALALGGDVDGDGSDDVLVGAFEDAGTHSTGGAAYLFTGALSGVASATATATIVPTATDQDVGWAVALGGDVNGDGVGDVLIGAPRVDTTLGNNSGAAYLFYGPLSGTYTLDDAGLTFEAAISAALAGTSVAFVPDLDADGLDEVLIGAEKDDTAANDAGAAYLLLGGGL